MSSRTAAETACVLMARLHPMRRTTSTRNSIHHNAGKGIENINGGNGELAPPVIANASAAGATGTACPDCDVQIFSDDDDQGEVFEVAVVANSSGDWSYSGPLTGQV